jgi:hypothetical protein
LYQDQTVLVAFNYSTISIIATLEFVSSGMLFEGGTPIIR